MCSSDVYINTVCTGNSEAGSRVSFEYYIYTIVLSVTRIMYGTFTAAFSLFSRFAVQ